MLEQSHTQAHFNVGLRVATFNLRNLAKPNFQFYPNSTPYSPEEYAAKCAWTVEQIDCMNADIIVFQEVFHVSALEEIIRASKTMRHAHIIARDAVQMPPKNNLVPQVAIVSKLPLAQEPIWLTHYPKDIKITPQQDEHAIELITRAVPHIAVTVPSGIKVHILGIHLKSKRPDYLESEDESNPDYLALATYRSLMRRSADAIAIRHYLNNLLKRNREPCIVTGDFNDHAHAVSTQIIMGSGRFGKSFYDYQLFDASRIQTKNDPQRYISYTYIHDGAYEVLDHMLVSEEFHPASRNQLAIVREVYNLNDHIHMHKPEASDHGQTVASFLFKNSADAH